MRSIQIAADGLEDSKDAGDPDDVIEDPQLTLIVGKGKPNRSASHVVTAHGSVKLPGAQDLFRNASEVTCVRKKVRRLS